MNIKRHIYSFKVSESLNASFADAGVNLGVLYKNLDICIRNMPLEYLLDENEYNFEIPLEALQEFTVPFKIRTFIRNVLYTYKCITRRRNFLFNLLTYCDSFQWKNAYLFSRNDIVRYYWNVII